MLAPQTQKGASVPVTARLSKRFYEQLGDDIANELVDWFNQVDATYRTDLRELNELNFARFDAKVEQRFGQFEQRFVQLEARMDRTLAEQREFLERRLGEQTRGYYAAWAVQVAATVAVLVRVYLG
jgi:hypothetical protein